MLSLVAVTLIIFWILALVQVGLLVIGEWFTCHPILVQSLVS